MFTSKPGSCLPAPISNSDAGQGLSLCQKSKCNKVSFCCTIKCKGSVYCQNRLCQAQVFREWPQYTGCNGFWASKSAKSWTPFHLLFLLWGWDYGVKVETSMRLECFKNVLEFIWFVLPKCDDRWSMYQQRGAWSWFSLKPAATTRHLLSPFQVKLRINKSLLTKRRISLFQNFLTTWTKKSFEVKHCISLL